MDPSNLLEKVVNLAKRRGFIFPSAELYGGLSGFWDFGPLGVELKNNLKAAWWRRFVQERDDVVGLESAIIGASAVWQASGHLKHFTDSLVECRQCHHRFKAEEAGGTCPDCGGAFVPAKQFQTMFKTSVGPAEASANVAYLRPETAQGIFVNFDTIRQTQRLKLPFGIAQIGKAFRNEITPGNFVFRSREFEQMEIEYFVEPGRDDDWLARWVEWSQRFFLDLGMKPNHLRLRQQKKDELAHYAKATTDLEYRFGFDKGWAELTGISNRQDYDLQQHGQAAKGDSQAFAVDGKVPYVIEPSFGVERAALAFLLDAYEEVKGGRTKTTESTKEVEVVLRLHPSLAPFKAAVLPLSKKPELAQVAQELAVRLRQEFLVDSDEVGSIGRRYRRQDEVGTPYCLTVDFETLTDHQVTIRDRDSMQQERVAIADVPAVLKEKFSGS